MSFEKYLDEMRSIQSKFLEFIEDNENVEENFRNLISLLEDKKIRDNKNDLKLFLHHVASVCANHHSGHNFFSKIERLLQNFKDDIKKYYINSEIFSIFKKNKRILLFLIEENIIIFDNTIAKKIIEDKYAKSKYPQYFAPEIKTFMDKNWFPKYATNFMNVDDLKKELPDNFYELRKNGENESYISKLIREDLVEDFIKSLNQGYFSLQTQIKQSIYETNSFIIKKQNESCNSITLIEYAAFFGSIQIIKYLEKEGVQLTPSMWLYAIHSQNAELIYFLEENHVEPTVKVDDNEIVSYKNCFGESIKCNHKDIANYILDNYLQGSDQMPNESFLQPIKHYNFEFIQKEQVNESSFWRLCKYDYPLFVDDLMTSMDININNRVIQNHIFQPYSKSCISNIF